MEGSDCKHEMRCSLVSIWQCFCIEWIRQGNGSLEHAALASKLGVETVIYQKMQCMMIADGLSLHCIFRSVLAKAMIVGERRCMSWWWMSCEGGKKVQSRAWQLFIPD